jgi:hypothetical protein
MQWAAPITEPATMFRARVMGMRAKRLARMPALRSRRTNCSSMSSLRTSGQPSRTRKAAITGWSMAVRATSRMPAATRSAGSSKPCTSGSAMRISSVAICRPTSCSRASVDGKYL